MRTHLDIDAASTAAAMQAGGFKTKNEAVEEGLRRGRDGARGALPRRLGDADAEGFKPVGDIDTWTS
ncbi:MAG: type II toxin-antitoxin system VapB family antitoxin [Thiomonas sp.]